jgi:hypothetical protein
MARITQSRFFSLHLQLQNNRCTPRFQSITRPQHAYAAVPFQLQASDIDRALVEGSLSVAGSVSSSPRTAHNIGGLRSPVVIKTLAKAALQVRACNA